MAGSGDAFFTLDEAKVHLRVTTDAEDSLIAIYVQTAQNLVMDRLERATTDSEVLAVFGGWDAATVPAGVQAAVLMQLTELYRFRGDDEYDPRVNMEGQLSQRVERYLGTWLERPLA